MFECEAIDFVGQTIRIKFDPLHPDHCPACHKHVNPTLSASYLDGTGNKAYKLTRVYRCPNADCGSVFLGLYTGVRNQERYIDEYSHYELWTAQPGTPIPPEIPDSIIGVSPTFVQVHEQAAAAEHYGLSEICGVGYRKALEFLVKDYLISIAESSDYDEETIKNKLLSACISDHIDDARVKELARRAAWLGNDETHYVRKWEGKDLACIIHE